MDEIRAICLDLDDTLWPVAPPIRRAERALYEWLRERFPRITQRYSRAAMREVRAEMPARHPDRAHDMTFLRMATLAHCARGAGYTQEISQEALAIFHEARNQVELYADVLPALDRLGDSYRVISLTNGNADLGRIGLLDYFEHSVSAAQVGAAKPDPEIFRRVLAITGLDADQVLHVGDDPVADVRGALEMGMRSAWLNREGIPWPEPCAPPEHELRGLYDLLELLGVGDGMRAREA